MKSSRQVLEGLNKNLEYLEWHVNDDDAVIVQDCIRHVSYLEEIINELIDETVDLNNSLKTKEQLTRCSKRLRGENLYYTFIEITQKNFK